MGMAAYALLVQVHAIIEIISVVLEVARSDTSQSERLLQPGGRLATGLFCFSSNLQ